MNPACFGRYGWMDGYTKRQRDALIALQMQLGVGVSQAMMNESREYANRCVNDYPVARDCKSQSRDNRSFSGYWANRKAGVAAWDAQVIDAAR